MHHEPAAFGVEPVEQPVTLEAELGQRLGLDEVLLVHGVPFSGRDGDRDERHRLALLPVEVRKQHLTEAIRSAASSATRVSSDASLRVVVGGAVTGLDDGGDASVVGLHRVEQRRGCGIAVSDQRPQPGVLAVVVGVEETHHPADVLADRDSLSGPGYGDVERASMARPRSRRSAS